MMKIHNLWFNINYDARYHPHILKLKLNSYRRIKKANLVIRAKMDQMK